MECPSCNLKMVGGICSCGYVGSTKEVEKGMLIDGEVHVMNCNLRTCTKRTGDTTVFCKYLLSLSATVDGYLVLCDPIFRGEVVQ